MDPESRLRTAPRRLLLSRSGSEWAPARASEWAPVSWSKADRASVEALGQELGWALAPVPVSVWARGPEPVSPPKAVPGPGLPWEEESDWPGEWA